MLGSFRKRDDRALRLEGGRISSAKAQLQYRCVEVGRQDRQFLGSVRVVLCQRMIERLEFFLSVMAVGYTG